MVAEDAVGDVVVVGVVVGRSHTAVVPHVLQCSQANIHSSEGRKRKYVKIIVLPVHGRKTYRCLSF